MNLPVKSISPSPATPRRELVRAEIPVQLPIIYRNLAHFKQRILPLKLRGWNKTENDNVVFDLFNSTHTLPKLCLSIDTGLNFTVSVFNWFLPDTHNIYSKSKRSAQHVSLTQVMASLEDVTICQGLTITEQIHCVMILFQQVSPVEFSDTACQLDVMNMRRMVHHSSQASS